MDKIDITMTATLRPSLIERTFISINEKIIKGDKQRYRLIINIDRIGENVKQKSIVKIAEKYFDDIIFNYSEKPSFPKAVKWVWENANSNYIFHIEDDWKIIREIDVDHMIDVLNKYPKLSSLRLNKFDTPNRKIISVFSGVWEYIKEDKFYITYDWYKQFGLNPILIKRDFIKEALPRMVDNINPEKQFRVSQEYMVPVISKWNYGIYSNPGDKALVFDIGFNWKRKNNFNKPFIAVDFLTWKQEDRCQTK